MIAHQKGIVHVVLLVLLAAIGLIAFLVLSNTLDFKNGILSALFPKPPSFASNEITFVDSSGNPINQTTSPTVNVQLSPPWAIHADSGSPQVAGATSYKVYDDSLTSGWTNGSYQSKVNFSNSTPVFSGNKSISFKTNKGFAGLELNAPKNFSTTGYTLLQFSVLATKNNQDFAIYLESNKFKLLARPISISKYGGFPLVTAWRTYTIPLSDLGGNNQSLGDITLQDNSGSPQSQIYVDAIQLINTSMVVPTPTKAPVTTPTATPAPLFTSSATLAEDANFTTNLKTISPINLNSRSTVYTFSSSSIGIKTLYVKFTASDGSTQTFSASIQLVSPSPTPTPVPTSVSGGSISGLHVSGAQILNSAGLPIRMVGVNFSGAEYTCIGNGGNWDVPATQATIDAMKTWHIRAVRIPLNEDCWLGINAITSTFAQNHRKAVVDFANLLVQNNIVPIINLHFSGDGVHAAKEQEPMANRVHSLDFWTSVATTFKGNSSVIFEPYNEPHLNDVSITGGSAWSCWKDGGCSVKGSQSGDGTFVVAGMQEIVNAIRATGATNIIIVTGEDWGSDLSSWVQYKPSDSLNEIAAGWHTYGDGLSCGNATCWNSTLANVLTSAPIVTTEIGQLPPQKGCAHDYIDSVMNWLDSHQAQGYLAWTWGPFNCAQDPALITNYTGSPTQTYGQGFKDHLLSLP